MDKSARLVRDGKTLKLYGPVNFRTVNGLLKQLRHELTAEVDCLDCSGINECDSAAISLLLACLRLAEKNNISLHIKVLNEQLLSLSHLYDVATVLQADVKTA